MLDATACDLALVLTCRAPVDLTPAGDLAALARQGRRYAAGEAVDEIELGLALVGLSAVSLALLPQTGAPLLRSGAGAARFLHRSGRLSPALAAPMRRAVAQGVDWARLPAVRRAEDLRPLIRPAAIAPAAAVVSDAGSLVAAAGARPALHLIGQARTPTELAGLARSAQPLGRRSLGRFEALGRTRFLRAGLRLSDTALRMILGLSSALAALAALVWQTALSIALRRLRRLGRA